jgi:surface protein
MRKNGKSLRRMMGVLLSTALILQSSGAQVLAEELPAELQTQTEVSIDVSSGDVSANAVADVAENVEIMANNSASVIASGTDCGLEWSISSDGLLIISGEYSQEHTHNDDNPWAWCYDYASSITSAKVTATEVGSTAYWFYECENLISVDVDEFDTSAVTDMSHMFCDCFQLTTLDVSKFDTSRVTNMWAMFGGCESLTTLDVSKFDTSNVTNIACMFSCCESLTTLDVSKFDTSKVTDMNGMFFGCSGLTTLDVSKFDTGKVKDMNGMFSGCSGLTTLNVSGFSTSKVTDMGEMFSGCSKLTTLDVSGFSTSKLTNMYQMFYGCSSLTTLDLSSFDMSDVEEASKLIASCTSLKEIRTPKNLSLSIALPVTMKDSSEASYTELPKGLYTSIVLTATEEQQTPENPGDDSVSVIASGTDCGLAWSISSDGLLTISGEYSSDGYYSGSWRDYSDKITCAKVTATGVMSTKHWFWDCTNLTSVDFNEFNTSQVTDMDGMFKGCSGLSTLDVSKFDTSSVTDMSRMFEGCSGLSTLDVSKFDTSSVTDMSQMFYGCSGLITLDVSKFDTSSVTDMSFMFSDCSNLTTLDVGKFATSKVTDMSMMFNDCSNLTTLDVSKFATGNVTDMDVMFGNCSNLTMLDVSKFDTSKVTKMDAMFDDCGNLTTLDVSNFDTRNVTSMDGMFKGCSGLTTLDVGNFNTSSVASMGYMFYDCSSLTTLDLSTFDTSNVTVMSLMFYDCSGLITLDVRGFDTSNVTDISYMFRGCSGLTTLDLSSFDLSSFDLSKSVYETNVAHIFSNCTSLQEIQTPKNLSWSIALPCTMQDDSGTYYTELPKGLSTSILLTAAEEPDVVQSYQVTVLTNQTYTGKALTPEVVVTYGAKVLTLGVDYKVSYANNVNVAASDAKKAPTATVKFIGDYSGNESLTATFTILPKTLTKGNTTVSSMVFKTDNKVKKPAPTVTADGVKLKSGTDFDVTFPDSGADAYKAPGQYSVVITGKGNYQGSVTATMVILETTQVMASQLKVATIPAYTYEEGSPATPTPKVTYQKKELTLGKDYTISYRNNDRAGKATLIITGLENKNEDGTYVYGTVEKTFTIKGTALSKAKATYNNKATFTGSEICPDVTLKVGETTLRLGKDYTVEYTNNINAGKGTILLTGCGGYTGTVKKTFTIQPASEVVSQLQVTVAGTDTSTAVPTVSYEQSGACPEVTVKVNSAASGNTTESVSENINENGTENANESITLIKGKDYAVTYKNNKKLADSKAAKAPTVVIKGKGNYKFTKEVTFTIAQKSLSDADIKITAADKFLSSKGKLLSSPVVTDAKGKKLKANKDYTVEGYYLSTGEKFDGSSTVASNTTITVKVQAKENGNYTGTAQTTYRIAAKDIAKMKITVKPQTYSGSAVVFTESMIKSGAVTITDKTTDLVYGTDYTIIGYKNNTKKGTATMTIRGIGTTYGGTKVVKFKIVAKK